MTKRGRIGIIITAGAVGTALGAWLWFCAPISDVPVFDIPKPSLGVLTTRYETAQRDSLLITRVPPPRLSGAATYRYDPSSRTLRVASRNDWDHAGGAITDPSSDLGGSSKLFITTQDGVLIVGGAGISGRAVPTRGQTALVVERSPSQNLVGVLTADGRERWMNRGWFFAFGGGYAGQHYVEFFTLPDMTPLGAVRIPFTTAERIDSPCWSEDGRYLVYTSANGIRMCVIHVDDDPKREQKP
jgi:hypothetical protein